MKNKQVKKMIYSGYCDLSSKYVNQYDKVKYEWSFDRMRLCEMNMRRQQLRHAQISVVSVTADQLRVINGQ